MAVSPGSYVLFSGCAGDRTGKPARNATVALAKALHVELWEPSHGGCCGARNDRKVSADERSGVLSPIFEGAGRGLDVVCLSPACRRVVASVTPVASAAGPATRVPSVRDVVQLFAGDYGVQGFAEAAIRELSPLRVAVHATCHGDHNPARGLTTAEAPRAGGMLARLKPGSRRTSPDKPVGSAPEMASGPDLTRLVEATGATSVGDASVRGRCHQHALIHGSVSRFLGGHGTAPCLALAAGAGADLLVTPCFLCYIGLNQAQRSLTHGDAGRTIPVLHLAQLLGVACQLAPGELGLAQTTVSARRALLNFVA